MFDWIGQKVWGYVEWYEAKQWLKATPKEMYVCLAFMLFMLVAILFMLYLYSYQNA